MKSIDRYMARLIAVPLFATLLIAVMLFVLDRMLGLFNFVATQGGPISVVWRMLANLLPEYLGLGIPIGLLLGILLAFRRLATSSELDVLRGVGMSYTRLLRVPYMYTIALALTNLAIVGYVQPIARYYYEGLRFELRTGALGASIKVGEFTHLGDRMTMRIEESKDKGRELSGIFVHAQSQKGDWIGVTAARGKFLATDDPNVIIFRLADGTLIHNRPEFNTPRVLTFSAHDLPINLPKFESFRSRGGRNLEYTLPELARQGHSASSLELRDSSRSEFHFRLAEVATMFLLPLLALALGVPPKRSSSAFGVFLSIVMIVTYHKVNQYAADIGELGRIDPIIALWVPFTLFAALILWMYYTIAYVPGGQPIGALERVFSKIAKAGHQPSAQASAWYPGMNIISFFPSRTVAIYMARLFLVRTFTVLAALVLVLQALDLLSESGRILAFPGNGDAQIWHYVGLRVPQIVARFLPFSVLLGTILTLITMNQNSEIIALKGSGLSAHQVLAPLLVASMGIAVISFVFSDRVVARATATLDQWQKVDYGALPIDRGDRADVWVRDGDDLIEVGQIRGRGDAARLSGITLYDRTGGNLVALIRANHGRHVAGGWSIWPAKRFDVAKGTIAQIGAITIAKNVRPDQFTLSSVDADGLSFGALKAAITDLSDAGRPTKALEGSLWHKLSGPLSAVLMPLLGAVAAFGIARSGKLFVRAVIGMALGFAYFVADNFALAMGNLGAYPPFLAAWAPFLLFFLIGEAVLIRSEE